MLVNISIKWLLQELAEIYFLMILPTITAGLIQNVLDYGEC
jgi:hypothetical protein